MDYQSDKISSLDCLLKMIWIKIGGEKSELDRGRENEIRNGIRGLAR